MLAIILSIFFGGMGVLIAVHTFLARNSLLPGELEAGFATSIGLMILALALAIS